MTINRVVLGIDPGLANTGWGVVEQDGSRLNCIAFGCISTSKEHDLSKRLKKIHDQIDAVITRYHPSCVGIETVWFGVNTQSAFATGQARGAALVACAASGLRVEEFSPKQIKLAIVGAGSAEKEQIQYMVKHFLSLKTEPSPDHAADALAAAICFTVYDNALIEDAIKNQVTTEKP